MRTDHEESNGLKDWLTCFAAFTIWLCSFGFQFSFGVIFTELLQEFGDSRSKTAWVGSLPVSLTMVMSPLALFVGQRYGQFKVMLGGVFLVVIALLLSSIASNIEQMICFFGILFGLGSASLLPFTYTALSGCFKKRLGTALGLSSSGSAVGALLFAPVLGISFAVVGWRSTYRILSVVMGLALLLVTIIIEKSSHRYRAATYSLKTFWTKAIVIGRNPIARSFILAKCITGLQFAVSHTHQVQFVIEAGVERSKAELLPTYMAIGSGAGRILAGFLFDQSLMTPVALFQLLLYLSASAHFLGLMAASYPSFIFYFVTVTLLTGAFQSQTFKVIASLVEDTVVIETFQIMLFTEGLLASLGPPLLGSLVDYTKSYDAIFYVSGIPLLAGATILFKCRWLQRNLKKSKGEKALINPVMEKAVQEGKKSKVEEIVFRETVI